MVATEKKYTLDELKLGMKVSRKELSEIYDTYMLIVYRNMTDTHGKLTFIGKDRDKTYHEIVSSGKPVCVVFNSKEEAEELYSYDE